MFRSMEGGIGILLLLILLVVAIGFAIAMYVTGGALLKSEDKYGGDDDGHRPEHKRPTSPTQEKVHMVGTRDDGEGDR
jgi:hypothetical protein